jgi:formate hydrogenlyase subunit 6/NADH:ubiquinone oxidoreductase subunit I
VETGELPEAVNVSQLPACLCLLSPAALYEIGLISQPSLYLDQCRACTLKPVLQRFEYLVGVASEWLHAGAKPTIFAFVEADLDDDPSSFDEYRQRKSPEPCDDNHNFTSRRDFFISLIKKGQRILTPASPESLPDKTIRGRSAYNTALPSWRKRLSQSFRAGADKPGRAACWPAIEKDEGCMDCGMCERFCPTGTLTALSTNKEERLHGFTPGTCLDCRICQLFCPEEAIKRSRKPEAEPFEQKTIRITKTAICRSCGAPTSLTSGSQTLCYWCERAKRNDQKMRASLHQHFTRPLPKQ